MTTNTSRQHGAPRAPQLDELVDEVSHLVSPPEIHLELEEAIESPYSSWQRVAEVIGQDPALSAQLLKLANSAYHAQRHVDTLSRAVALLGTRILYDLAVGASAMSVFQRLSTEVLDLSAFWRHSLATGMIAKTLAQHAHMLHPERLFVAGLLHEIGLLVLCMRLPELMDEVLARAQGDETRLAAEERKHLGYDHAEVGARLLELWQLPAATITAIRHHHRPGLTPGPGLDAALVHLAEHLANARAETSLTGLPAQAPLPVEEPVWAMAGIGPDGVEALVPSLEGEIQRAARLLGL